MTDTDDQQVMKFGTITPLSAGMMMPDVLAAIDRTTALMTRWWNATPAQREQWARESEEFQRVERERRAALRLATSPAPLTIGALIDKLGISEAYAHHLVQPYCTCEIGADGWERCEHAQDLDLW